MSLFQKSVEKKYLNELDSVLIDQKYKAFQDYFGNPSIQENIRNSKEEQFQEGFLRELFVNILGYTLNPEPYFNLTTELKNIDNSKKADGAILKGEDAIAVIELKGTDTTDLDKIEKQAFGYKNHHPKCVYVITSNFEKLRFYIQNAVDHIDFDLFNLTREQFSLMWLCLAKDNLLNGLPQKIKESSLLQEENITKKLYADYSKFREAIYNNLVKNNIENKNGLQSIVDKKGNPVVLDKLTLFKKTQKLLDRFLFIFFAEDRLLLPPNSISEIVKQWNTLKDLDAYVPLYDRFKLYFGYMNTGHKGKKYDIFAYNGGLFAPDEILDNISIDDDILHEHTLRLSNYDFETDVDVNILGHIFEHSLGEIENVQAEIASVEAVNNGLQPIVKSRLSAQSKRKKDGIFYTPKYITKYIVENTVGKLCEEKRTELDIVDEKYAKGRKNRKKDTITALDKKLTDYRNWLLSLTILDPACGSGAFLNQALDFLITEHRKIDHLRAQLFGGGIVFSDITTNILEKNIYGVDLNEESVEIAKLSLWLRTAQKGRKLNKLNNNIKCGNSLIDDPEVAGEKAFNWYTEFPNIFHRKQKKVWHVTTATHNSRYSQRMFDNHVVVGEPLWFDKEDEIIISETVRDIAIADKLNILEYNICGDHMHILLVCEEEELTKIVGKLKSVTAKERNRKRGYTTGAAATADTAVATRGHAPLSEKGTGTSATEDTAVATRGHSPSSSTRGITQRQVWTQKFGKSEIKDEEYLRNAIEYIRNNRKKHELPEIKEIEKLKKEFLCSPEHAFRTEYTGGFDVVIGNPPYVDMRSMQSNHIQFFKKYFNTASNRLNLFVLFIEKAFNLMNLNSKYGMIIHRNLIRSNEYEKCRELILKKTELNSILSFKNGVFYGVTGEMTVLVFSKKSKIKEENYVNILNFNIDIDNNIEKTKISQTVFKNCQGYRFNVYITEKKSQVLSKFQTGTILLGSISNTLQGIIAGDEKKFISLTKIDEIYKPIVRGRDIHRYSFHTPYEYIYFIEGTKVLTRSRKKENFEHPEKILTQHVSGNITAYFDTENLYYMQTINGTIVTDSRYSAKYIISLLNSKAINFYYDNIFNIGAEFTTAVAIENLNLLPIPNISFEAQQPFIEKADLMLSLNKQLQTEKSNFINSLKEEFGTRDRYPLFKITNKLDAFYELEYDSFKKELLKQKVKISLGNENNEWREYFNTTKQKVNEIQKQISETDKEIDQMVYELYGLSEEEIKLVEG